MLSAKSISNRYIDFYILWLSDMSIKDMSVWYIYWKLTKKINKMLKEKYVNKTEKKQESKPFELHKGLICWGGPSDGYAHVVLLFCSFRYLRQNRFQIALISVCSQDWSSTPNPSTTSISQGLGLWDCDTIGCSIFAYFKNRFISI